MESTAHKPAAPFYAVAVVWLAGGLLLPLYRPLHYGLVAAVSAAVFLVVNRLCQSAAPKAEAAPAKPAEQDKPTGDPALDKALKDGRLAIAEMKRLDVNIADEEISADIVQLEQVCQGIFQQVRADPGKLPQIRKFMDYYLPTTLKLLNAYDRASSAGVSGENINATLANVKGILRTVVSAFEKQLDALFGSEALDISTDVTVLENMLAREGLAGDQLHAETSPKADGGIDLKL